MILNARNDSGPSIIKYFFSLIRAGRNDDFAHNVHSYLEKKDDNNNFESGANFLWIGGTVLFLLRIVLFYE